MARTKISEFSPTPANNTDIDNINIAEGCAPSGINDAIRELMAQLKDFQAGTAGDSFNGPVGTSTAAAGAFTNLTVSGTLAVTGVATLTAQPILSSLTASRAVFTDASKGLVSNAITGTGNVVMSASPTLTGTIAAEALTTSGAVTHNGGTANGVTYLNGSKVLTSGSALTFDGNALTAKTMVVADGANGTVQFGSASTYGISGGVDNGGLRFNLPSGVDYQFRFAGSDAMRLTSTGLGIGTSSISSQISGTSKVVQLQGAFGGVGSYKVTDTAGTTAAEFWASATGVVGISATSNSPFLFSTNNIERMRLDPNGNLGLGVTPSAWGGSWKALEFVGGTAIANNNGNAITMTSNAYWNGSNYIYKNNWYASYYQQNDGKHIWNIAPSGTAGNAISFTQAMTLDASGNLGIGTSSPNAKVCAVKDGAGGANGNTTSSAWGSVHVASAADVLGFAIRHTGSTFSGISGNAYATQLIASTTNSNAFEIYTTGATPLVLGTNATERARIDSNGNFIQSAPTTEPTLATNGQMVFNLTSNTNLRVSVRGSDGVTRTANLTLA